MRSHEPKSYPIWKAIRNVSPSERSDLTPQKRCEAFRIGMVSCEQKGYPIWKAIRNDMNPASCERGLNVYTWTKNYILCTLLCTCKSLYCALALHNPCWKAKCQCKAQRSWACIFRSKCSTLWCPDMLRWLCTFFNKQLDLGQAMKAAWMFLISSTQREICWILLLWTQSPLHRLGHCPYEYCSKAIWTWLHNFPWTIKSIVFG